MTKTIRWLILVTLIGACGRAQEPAAQRPTPEKEEEPLGPAGTVSAEIDLGGAAQGVAIAGGFVWVGLHHGGGVAKIDPANNEVLGRFPTGNRPGSLTADDEALWVSNYGSSAETVSVTRVDPGTGEVTATITHPDLPDLCCDPALGDGTLWIPTGGAQALVGIDTDRGKVSATHRLETAVDGLAHAEGLVWIGDGAGAEGSILGIDPETGEVIHRVPVGDSPTVMVADDGRVWGVNATDAFAIDPAEGTLTVRIPVDVIYPVITAGEGAVWVVGKHDGKGVLYRLDPDAGRVVGRTYLGETPSRVATGLGSVWVTDFDSGVVFRVSP